MRYFKSNKEKDAPTVEISKEEARHLLDGWWKEDALNDIFKNDRAFRLFTAYVDVWTMSDDGLVPMPGFYGTVG